MIDLMLPVLVALLVWWLGTGVIFWLVRLPRATHRRSMVGATVALLVALWLLRETGNEATALGAYLAFAAAIVAWGWIELGFLTGHVTGSRRTPCPPSAGAWWRAGMAIQAILHHELALVAVGGAIAAAVWDAPNQVGLWTFLLLWAMRLSAKLNLFLGVANRNSDLLPENLRFMDSFFARRPINWLFPVSVSAGAAGAALLWATSAAPESDPHLAAGAALLAALTILGLLEHWMMVLPISATALWRWALGSGASRSSANTSHDAARAVLDGARRSVGSLRPPTDRRSAAVALPTEARPSVAGASPCAVVPLPVSSGHRRRP